VDAVNLEKRKISNSKRSGLRAFITEKSISTSTSCRGSTSVTEECSGGRYCAKMRQ